MTLFNTFLLSCGISGGIKRNFMGMVNDLAESKKMNNFEFDGEKYKQASDFDVIFSNAALHWVKNHEKLLKNSLAALKPNGLIKWNFAGDGNCSNFFDIVKSVMNENAYKEYFIHFEWPWYMPSKEEYEKLIAKTGFSNVHITHENADRYFADCDEMVRWIDQPSIVPFIKCLPDGQKENFRNTVIDRMIERTKQPDGRCFETFRRINIKARK